MKAYDYDAVVYNGSVYCVECLSAKELKNSEPIFADSEWDYIPVCEECGYEHDYVNILENSEN